ncbi:TPA: hypothetical protein OUB54_000559 [Proteus mirabilis]|nr:hypothetical protein [Proteus mirabilis]
MKERGIIFNAEMVRAILDGRKTQTRRVMNNQPCTLSGETISVQQDDFNFRWAGDLHNDTSGWFPCPLGKVGDRLWVRETWMPDAPRDGTWGDVEFYGCKDSQLSMIPERFRKSEYCIHRASWDGAEMIGWTPSIHMPRWASRITLEITDVRVERLKDAGDTEFKAEGYPLDRELTGGSMDPFCWFRNLWDSVSPTNFKYEDDPWVWVIEFKRL